MTKCKEWFGLVFVHPSVAHEYSFLVFLVDDVVIGAPNAGVGIQTVGWHIVKYGRPSEWQLS